MSEHITTGRELSASDLDAVIGGAVPVPTHQVSPSGQPNLLVVIAIIAILIG